MNNYIKLDNYNNFFIPKTFNDNAYLNLKESIKEVIKQFEIIFGLDIMIKKDCYININKLANCPQIVTTQTESNISLVINSTIEIDKFIYQLSHELCHYVLYIASNGKKPLDWFEEILCEAMSIYILHSLSKNWSNTSIENYSLIKFLLNHYLIRELNNISNYKLESCNSLTKLKSFNKNYFNIRANKNKRIVESNKVYMLFKEYPENINLICDYQQYNIDSTFIDFHSWLNHTNKNIFLTKLKKIQPYLDL